MDKSLLFILGIMRLFLHQIILIMKIEWKGVMPAVTTKFTADDTLDLEIRENYLQPPL